MIRFNSALPIILLMAVCVSASRAEGLHATPSSSWEREISLQCHQKYLNWLKNKQAVLETESKIYPQRQRSLSPDLAKAHEGKDAIAFTTPLESHIWKYEAPEAADVGRPFEVSAAKN